ncbi:hypothetical protein AAFF_G00127500 [Aldrovandia affinis]|uniref:N-acetylglucosaminylphosphatidylinositol deacetylase n=1 Tax=Aldrovandia affinis TaxID=143900 RepID=A0AAD7T0Z5_9TELE|nr:hypothetical protein AAFF_G00127500 [Aldrovandia affinis]
MLFGILVLCFLFSLYLIWLKVIYYRYSQNSGSNPWLQLNKKRDRRMCQDHLYPWQSEHENYFDDVRALLVTAHPDDECMFFAPTILRLLQSSASVHLLCLSSGNYYNQGDLRQKELRDSCNVLGIPASQVTIVDHKELPDDPSVEWNTHIISSMVLKQVKASSINMVLTFDGRGVSGHANHIAIYRALSYLASTRKIPDVYIISKS